MADDLDLYANPINWRKIASIFGVFVLIVGAVSAVGYRWVTTTTAVSRDAALEIFKKETAQADAEGDTTRRKQRAANKDERKNDRNRAKSRPSKRAGTGSITAGSATNGNDAVASGTREGGGGRQGSSNQPRDNTRFTPEEGVYSWATEGWEEAAGIRRDFPEESQRIITASDDDSWKEHHYFSEEREIWTDFAVTRKGAHVAMQRNRAKFGPVTNDSTVDFAPPMLVGLAKPRLGAAWKGEWEGRTSGSYTGRVFDHSTVTIGGEDVEVWGYETRMQMTGELNGTVIAQVMYSPKYGMTVQEHYTQDIQTDRGRYRAEWTMTVKSTTPET